MNNEQIKSELEEKVNRYVSNVRFIDGKVIADFSGCEEEDCGHCEYWSYPKAFDSIKDFAKFLEDFFKLT
jgi:uncharacterized Fe-S cluster-containing radical SAM superfamily protein